MRNELTLSQINLVHKPRQNVAILNREIVMRAKHIGGDDGSEVAAILLVVCSAQGELKIKL